MIPYPKAVGPYSPYYRAGKMLYCSGQIGIIPESMKIIEGGVNNETQQIIKNIAGVLQENGLDFSDIVKTTIYLTHIQDFSQVNDIYGKYFFHKPARSTVAVKELPLGALVEIEVIAIFKN